MRCSPVVERLIVNANIETFPGSISADTLESTLPAGRAALKIVLGHTDKKENQIFLIYVQYKEIQNGAIAKSYMGK
jgi:hypothetical protein